MTVDVFGFWRQAGPTVTLKDTHSIIASIYSGITSIHLSFPTHIQTGTAAMKGITKALQRYVTPIGVQDLGGAWLTNRAAPWHRCFALAVPQIGS